MTDSLEPLRGKRRSYGDLSRFLVTRTSEVPNFTMLLGAGCSITSGVRSASELTAIWKSEVFKSANPEIIGPTDDQVDQYLKTQEASWFTPSRAYSCLFERRFDLPRQRRIFIEAEVAEREPSIGYAYLIKLVEAGYINTLFTTNFDDLINEAFFRFSDLRPIVCAHDSSVSSISVTSKRPKVIKLHGDYLFDDIKATVRETESLEENIKKKFSEFSREHGLIVAGYSGGDRSIMEVITHLLRSEEYFRHGVYWCIRRGDAPSEDLLKMLWKDRVYFVEIDGFDELMAQLHRDAIGDQLPVETSLISDKPRRTVASFCSNKYLLQSSSSVIQKDIERLRRLSDRERFIDVIRDVTDKESHGRDDVERKMSDDEVGTFISSKHKLSMGDYAGARVQLKDAVESASSWQAKEEFLIVSAKNEEAAGDNLAAAEFVEDLIRGDPKEVAWLLWRSNLSKSFAERMAVIDSAVKINPYSSESWCEKADLLAEQMSGLAKPGEDNHRDVCGAYQKSLSVEPGINNDAWSRFCDYLSGLGKVFPDSKTIFLGLLEAGMNQGPQRMKVLRARMDFIHSFENGDKSKVDALIGQVVEASDSANRHSQMAYDILHLDLLYKFKRLPELSRKISDMSQSDSVHSNPHYLKRRAAHSLMMTGDLGGAIVDMERAVSLSNDSQYILKLAEYLKCAKRTDEILTLIDDKSKFLSPHDRLKIMRFRFESEGDYKSELEYVRKIHLDRTFPVAEAAVDESHVLLVMGNYAEAEAVSKDALDKVGFDIEHAALIINYEISRDRGGGKLNKGRLANIASGSANEEAVACAEYLLGDIESARTKFSGIMSRNKGRILDISEWAVFQDSKGRDFLRSCAGDSKAKPVKLVA
ncbi:SIR2 family protein [Stenotrophomonas maltophilia]|uniref:SIR2 family protein n=1 Tax=Stenotrophomonas maltophilia TaxID=40324 RepID=UPI003BF8CDA5